MDDNIYNMSIGQGGDNSPPLLSYFGGFSQNLPVFTQNIGISNICNGITNSYLGAQQHHQPLHYLTQPKPPAQQYLENSSSFNNHRMNEPQFTTDSDYPETKPDPKRVLHVEFQIMNPNNNNGEKHVHNNGNRPNHGHQHSNYNNRNSSGFEDPNMQQYRCKGNIVRHIMGVSWKNNNGENSYEATENYNEELYREIKGKQDSDCIVQKIISINNNIQNGNKGEIKKGSSFLVEFKSGIGQQMAEKQLNGKKVKVNGVEYSLRIEVSANHDKLTIRTNEYSRLGNNYPNKWNFVVWERTGLPPVDQENFRNTMGVNEDMDVNELSTQQHNNLYVNNNNCNIAMINASNNQKHKHQNNLNRRSFNYSNGISNDQSQNYNREDFKVLRLEIENRDLKVELDQVKNERDLWHNAYMKALTSVPYLSNIYANGMLQKHQTYREPARFEISNKNLREDFCFTIELKNTDDIRKHLYGEPEIDRPDHRNPNNLPPRDRLAGENRKFCVEYGILNFTFYRMMDDIFTLFGLHADVSEINGYIKNPFAKASNQATFLLDIVCKGYSIDAYCSQDDKTCEDFGVFICHILNEGLANALYDQSPKISFNKNYKNREMDNLLTNESINPNKLFLIDIKKFHAKKDVHRYRLMNPNNDRQKSSRDGNGHGPKSNGLMTDRFLNFSNFNDTNNYSTNNINLNNNGPPSINKSNNKHQLTKPSKYLHISNFERSEANKRGNHPKDDRVKLESIEELEEKLMYWWNDRYPEESFGDDLKKFQKKMCKIVKYNRKNRNLEEMMNLRNNCSDNYEPESGYRTSGMNSNDSGEYQNDNLTNQSINERKPSSAAEKPWIVIEFPDIPTAVKGLFAFHSKEVKKDKNLHLRVAFSENKESFAGNGRDRRED